MSQEGQRGLRGGQLAQHEGSEGFGLGPAPLLARHVAAGRAHGHGWDLVSFPLGRCRLTPEGPSRGSGASQHHAACSGEFPHADIHCLPPSSLFFFFFPREMSQHLQKPNHCFCASATRTCHCSNYLFNLTKQA